MIDRFLKAQETSYDCALDEIKSGRKRTHWMWYVFPQIKGLGHSMTSIFYSITDIEEAREYLAHPVLGMRLREIAQALLGLDTCDPHAVFGPPDDFKLRSSMTLFDAVEPHSVFEEVLIKYFDGVKDRRTLKILSDQ